ncbi:lipopolysaccharide biosynthesis protein [Tenuifilum sp.]|uniref:lipopolysaccharide biosynthesis protein n=1 Tax=Tenuifilum sp. TaxID=2760880 RepID=UPI001B47D5EA|nr:oligosaccharide flippase family protein [Bacteroidales bacterium]HOK60566.1 oligosaccharide flippase family protein [Tenuifilum sp.]HOK85127.1 oligosaccharide flippase family protein [Tenuifilum sp.]HPP89577.1 oligosaccharide flippase family protein [Tenuifilum sp.]
MTFILGKMSSVKQLYSQSIIYGLSTIVPRLLNYLLVPIHTNVLTDPRQYGVITEFYAYISFLLIFLTFGLETGYFRFVNKYKNDERVYSNAFTFVLTLSSIFFIAAYLFSDSISSLLGSGYLPIYIITTAAIVSLDSITALPFAKLRNQNRPLVFSFIKITGVAINVLLNIIFYLVLKPSYLKNLFPHIDLLFYVFLSNFIQNIVVFVLVTYFTGFPKIRIDKSLMKELIWYSFPILLAGLSGTTNEAFDRLFIKYLLPKSVDSLYQLGIYGACVKLAVLLVLFVQMYRFAAEPFFFKSSGSQDHNKLFGKSFKYFLIFSIVISLLITFNLPILKFFIGKNYRESLYIVPILLLANIFYGLFFNLSFWYKLADKTIYGLKYTVIGSIITIFSNIILIPIIGIYGAALSRLITYVTMTIMSYSDGRTSGFVSFETKNIKFYIIFILFITLSGTLLLVFLKPYFSLIAANILIGLFIYKFIKKENIKITLWR